MKRYIFVGAVVIGMVASAGAGAYVGYLKAKKEFEETLEAEMEALRSAYKPSEGKDDKDVERPGKTAPKGSEKGLEGDFVGKVGEYKKYSNVAKTYDSPGIRNRFSDRPSFEDDKPSLDDLAAGYSVPGYEEEAMDPEDDFVDPHPEHLGTGFEDSRMPDPRGREPHLIEENEYAYGDPTFGKVTITYYEGDDRLVDTDGSVMDLIRVVGERAAERLRTKEETCLYVRNERLGMDYEVVCDEGCYFEPDEGNEDD